MARLIYRGSDGKLEIFRLRLGRNRLGRGPENELQIESEFISHFHCEFVLSDAGVLALDCGSANGTLLDGSPLTKAWLRSGQILHVGDVDLEVDATEITVEPPVKLVDYVAPPVSFDDGSMMCRIHPDQAARFQCSHCQEVLCDTCVHCLRIVGGRMHVLCPHCSHPCRRLGPAQPPAGAVAKILRKVRGWFRWGR